MRNKRRFVVVMAGVAAVVGGVALAQDRAAPKQVGAAPSSSPLVPLVCEVAAVGAIGEAWSMVTDASGRYVAATPAGWTVPSKVLVSGPAGLQTLTAPPRFEVVGVNGSGTVIGNEKGDVGEPDAGDVASVIEGGVAVALGKPAGAGNVSANAINDAGDIAGSAHLPDGTRRAVVWRHGRWNDPHLLATPPGRPSTAEGIATDGTIVGSTGKDPQPYLWRPDGTPQPLTTPPGRPGGIASHIAGEWAAGPVKPPLSWARWNLRTGEVAAITGEPDTATLGGVTADGTVIVNDGDTPTLWTEAGRTRLQAPKDGAHWRVTGAAEHGTLVGTTGSGFDTNPTAVRAMCR